MPFHGFLSPPTPAATAVVTIGSPPPASLAALPAPIIIPPPRRRRQASSFSTNPRFRRRLSRTIHPAGTPTRMPIQSGLRSETRQQEILSKNPSSILYTSRLSFLTLVWNPLWRPLCRQNCPPLSSPPEYCSTFFWQLSEKTPHSESPHALISRRQETEIPPAPRWSTAFSTIKGS